MRKAKIFVDNKLAGVLEEIKKTKQYRFVYEENYTGAPVSLLMPVSEKAFVYETFPPFFDGLLPEGIMLKALIQTAKIDADDLFSQLVTVGHDLVGNVTVEGFE